MSNECAFVLQGDDSSDQTTPSKGFTKSVETSTLRRFFSQSWSPTAKIAAGILTIVAFLAVLRVACVGDPRSGSKASSQANPYVSNAELAGWVADVQGASLGGFFLDWTSEDLPDGLRCFVVFPFLSYYSFFFMSGSADSAETTAVGVCPGGCQDIVVDENGGSMWSNALYQVSFASSDGVEFDISIDGTSYDQSHGCGFLLTLVYDGTAGADTVSATGSTVNVRQVALDLSGVDITDVDASIPELVEQSDEFLAFAEAVAATTQNGDSGNS